MKLRVRFKGGPGSGHHGHSGRPGKHGGSLPGTGSGLPNSVQAATDSLQLGGGKESIRGTSNVVTYDINNKDEVIVKLRRQGWEVEYKDGGTTELSNEDGTGVSVTANRVEFVYSGAKPVKEDITALKALMDPIDSKTAYNGKFTTKFADNDVEVLSYYKTEGYREINRLLRTGHTDSSQIKQLDSILSESRIGMDGYVFRGLKLTGDNKVRMNDPSYTSWTADSFIAMDFAKGNSANTILALKVSSNDVGLRLDIITRTLTDEYEVLLPRGLAFKEVSRKTFGSTTLIEVEYE